MSKPTSDCRATERKHPWPMVRLGDVCETISTRGHQIKQSEIRESGKYPVVSQSEHDVEGWTDEDIAITQVPLVLFGDHTCVVKKIEFPFVVGADGTKLLKSKSHDNTFLFYALQRAVASLVDGKYRRHYSDLVEIEIPLPSLSVQREIVARLERELAAVEKMKKGFEALAETAKAEFKAELKEVFEELKHRGTETRKLGDVCELIKDGEHKTPRRVESYCGYYLLSARNVKDDNLALEDVDYVDKEEFERIARRCRPIAGDVLVSCSGSVGRVCVAGDAAYVMVRSAAMVRASKFDSRFLMFMLQSDWLQKQIAQLQRQAAQANLFLGAIAELNVHVPPLFVQREVVARLDAAKARAEKLEAKARAGVAVCEAMRKAILKEAFA